jgi:hypothetical protein
MDHKISNQKGSVTIWPEKLYSQHEVDDLLEEKKNGRPSLATKIEDEKQTSDKLERLDNKTVAGLVKKSNRLLATISSHAFPVDLFPDTINVEEGRVTIITRHMLSSEVHSVDIRDISNIFINTTIFFSQLVIISNTFEDNEITIEKLRPKEAVFIRRIIEGMRIFENKQIDTSTYTTEELVAKLEELSTTEIVT